MKRRMGTVVAACAVIGVTVAPVFGSEQCGPFPRWSTGDIEFSVDLATFLGDDERSLVQINCSIGNDQVRFIETDSGEILGLLELQTEFVDEAGRIVDRASQEFEVRARSMLQAEKRDVIQVVQVGRLLAPGAYRLKVVLLDQRAPKVGIWYALRGIKRSGEIVQDVLIRDLRRAGPQVSDLSFARSIRPDSMGGEFSRRGLEVIPNPNHIYGLRLAELAAYVEIYDGRENPSADTLMMEYLIRDNHGERVLGQTRAVSGEGRVWPKAFSIPLGGLEEGSYELAITVQDPETLEKTSSRACFDVMWSMLMWDRSLQEGLEEFSLILTDDELDVVSRLSPGERESYMREYWKSLDPTPETVQNEALQEYYRRVKYANEHYSMYRKGMFSDQGRIYVKYGPPDDVRRDSAWGMGVGASDLANPGASHEPGSPGHRRVDETGLQFREMGIDETSRESSRLDNLQAVGKTFETWVYDGGGRPLSGQWAWRGAGKKMKFVFVDQRGYGDLDLVYSSEGEDY